MHERYRVAYDVGVAKDLRKLDRQVRKRVRKRIDKLAKGPRPHGVVKLTNEYGLYRIRVGDFWGVSAGLGLLEGCPDSMDEACSESVGCGVEELGHEGLRLIQTLDAAPIQYG